jgi:hypothetical protein
MLLVFGSHDYGNGYFYRMRIWISYGNRWCYLISCLPHTIESTFLVVIQWYIAHLIWRKSAPYMASHSLRFFEVSTKDTTQLERHW